MNPDFDLAILAYPELFAAKPSKAQRTQLQLIETAIHCYGRYGIDKSNFDLISRRAKVSRALVQHYFPKQETLVRAAIRFIRARFQKYCIERMATHTTPVAQLDAYLRATFAWLEEYNWDARVWLLFYYYCSFNKEYRALNSELVMQGHKRITLLIEAGAAAGAYQNNDPSGSAKLLQNVLTGALAAVLTENYDPGFDVLEETVTHCHAIAREGKRANPPRPV